MKASEISVSVVSQSNRTENVVAPLKTTAMDVRVDPPNFHDSDIVVVETPDRQMAKEVLKNPFRNSKLVFRMRGDPFYGIDEWFNSRVKEWVAKNIVLPNVDGCVTITPSHKRLFEKKTGIDTVVAKLPAFPNRWPETIHQQEQLRILTFTNCMYKPKVDPLIEAAPVVDDLLSTIGGKWIIGGKGNYTEYLRNSLNPFNHVEFGGYLDAHNSLEWANTMLHLSRLDGWPNAILEGMSARLPVITNDHHAFTDSNRPNIVTKSHNELKAVLKQCANPQYRQSVGNKGREYVIERHHPNVIGPKYVKYFKQLLSNKSKWWL